MSRRPVNLALLPLENLSGADEDARLARGFVQDLITELARFPALGVIAADSVFATGCDGKSTTEIARELRVRHLLRGSLRRHGEALRISVQLLEADTGHHLWAARFDEEDLPTVHDEIAAKIANALAVHLDQSLLAAARRRQPASLAAYECWLRGMECLQRGTAEADAEGRAFFERALAADPHDARAHAGMSLSHFNEWSCQTWELWEEKERLAYDHATQAEALDPDDALVQMILARIEQYRREFDRAGPRLELARRLAPNDAGILVQLGLTQTLQGNPELALDAAERALELNPLCPPWYFCFASLPLFAMRRYTEFLAAARKAPPGLVVDVPAYRAAAHAYLGQRDEASAALAEFRADFTQRIACGRKPDDAELFRWVLHVNPYRDDADLRHFAEGLRRAGLAGKPKPRSAAPPVPWPVANIFRREGGWWTISFEGNVAQLPDMRGLHDLRRLLARPGEEIPSAELAGAALHSAGIERLDERALRAYRERLRDLDADLEQACAIADERRAIALEREREHLLREIGSATGIGGRVRATGGVAEKARTAVTWRIRHAIKKLEAVHPALGRHLSNSVRTGAFCRYSPEKTTRWHV